MPTDGRSRDEWVAELRMQAEAAWGSTRTAEMDAALTRMAEALQRVAERAPRAESLPYAPTPDASGAAADG